MNERILGNAIIEQNCKDYVYAIKRGNDKQIKECESFFNSDWYCQLTNLDGKWLIIKLLKKEVFDLFQENVKLKKEIRKLKKSRA